MLIEDCRAVDECLHGVKKGHFLADNSSGGVGHLALLHSFSRRDLLSVGPNYQAHEKSLHCLRETPLSLEKLDSVLKVATDHDWNGYTHSCDRWPSVSLADRPYCYTEWIFSTTEEHVQHSVAIRKRITTHGVRKLTIQFHANVLLRVVRVHHVVCVDVDLLLFVIRQV